MTPAYHATSCNPARAQSQLEGSSAIAGPFEIRSWPSIHNQAQSMFVGRLPLEIRIQIYQEMLSDLGHKRHIRFEQGKLKSIRCIESVERAKLTGECGPAPRWDKNHYWCVQLYERARLLGICGDNSYLFLLRSCKRVYSETICLLYASIKLHLIGLHTPRAFLSTVPPETLNSIKSLQLSWIPPIPLRNCEYAQDATEYKWETLCQKLAGMIALKDLKITLHNFEEATPDALLPLWAIHAEKFLVELYYHGDLDTTGAPFQIRRITQDYGRTIWINQDVSTSNPADDPKKWTIGTLLCLPCGLLLQCLCWCGCGPRC